MDQRWACKEQDQNIIKNRTSCPGRAHRGRAGLIYSSTFCHTRTRHSCPLRSTQLRHQNKSRAQPHQTTQPANILSLNLPDCESIRNANHFCSLCHLVLDIMLQQCRKSLTPLEPQASTLIRGLLRCPFNTVCSLPNRTDWRKRSSHSFRLSRFKSPLSSVASVGTLNLSRL